MMTRLERANYDHNQDMQQHTYGELLNHLFLTGYIHWALQGLTYIDEPGILFHHLFPAVLTQQARKGLWPIISGWRNAKIQIQIQIQIYSGLLFRVDEMQKFKFKSKSKFKHKSIPQSHTRGLGVFRCILRECLILTSRLEVVFGSAFLSAHFWAVRGLDIEADSL